MNWKALAIAGIFSVGIASSVQAVDWTKILCLDWCWPHNVQQSCGDDYCGKPMPCVPPVRCFGADDYCPKCEPCAKWINCFDCDDYRYKCPPILQRPSCIPLKCVPTSEPVCSCGKPTCRTCQAPRVLRAR